MNLEERIKEIVEKEHVDFLKWYYTDGSPEFGYMMIRHESVQDILKAIKEAGYKSREEWNDHVDRVIVENANEKRLVDLRDRLIETTEREEEYEIIRRINLVQNQSFGFDMGRVVTKEAIKIKGIE